MRLALFTQLLDLVCLVLRDRFVLFVAHSQSLDLFQQELVLLLQVFIFFLQNLFNRFIVVVSFLFISHSRVRIMQ